MGAYVAAGRARLIEEATLFERPGSRTGWGARDRSSRQHPAIDVSAPHRRARARRTRCGTRPLLACARRSDRREHRPQRRFCLRGRNAVRATRRLGGDIGRCRRRPRHFTARHANGHSRADESIREFRAGEPHRYGDPCRYCGVGCVEVGTRFAGRHEKRSGERGPTPSVSRWNLIIQRW